MQWLSGDQRAMVVPPGDYQVAMQPTFGSSQRVVWPQKVQILPDQQVTFKLDSGVQLEMPKEMGPLWQWQLVRFGKPTKRYGPVVTSVRWWRCR